MPKRQGYPGERWDVNKCGWFDKFFHPKISGDVFNIMHSLGCSGLLLFFAVKVNYAVFVQIKNASNKTSFIERREKIHFQPLSLAISNSPGAAASMVLLSLNTRGAEPDDLSTSDL